MKYEKPEIAVLGEATLLVRGSKTLPLVDGPGQLRAAPDAELDEQATCIGPLPKLRIRSPARSYPPTGTALP